MPKTPFLEKGSSLQVLGAAFVALIIFFVWLTWAFFTKVFVDRETVYLQSDTLGLQLPKNGDVKLRGMIVGEVKEFKVNDKGVLFTLGIIPEKLDEIPAGVTARIIPKTLFGQKYVSLVPPEEKVSGHLQAGDTITNAKVPIEIEQLLNNTYPLLDSINPADLSYTLSALSTALSGRGEKLGDTLVDVNAYLSEINPDVPNLVNDLVQLGNVSDIYADAAPDLTRFLNNFATTSQTIVSQREQLAAFFDSGNTLFAGLDGFLETNESSLISLADDGAPLLALIADYSPSFPCVQEALSLSEPRISNAFRNGKLHIDAQFFGPTVSPTGYTSEEHIVGSQAEIDANPLARANCLELEEIIAGGDPYPNTHPYSFQDDTIYGLVGLKTRHNKFCVYEPGSPAGGACDDGPLPRAAAGSLFGSDSDEVPDVASLLFSSLYRGSGVSN